MFQEHKSYHNRNFILILFIIIVLNFFYFTFFSKEINIKPFHLAFLTVQSNSMSPVFKKNDIIIIQEKKEYEIGDIITYQSENGSLITHRIIEKSEDVFYTQGDDNNTKDEEEITKSKIRGKVIFILKLK